MKSDTVLFLICAVLFISRRIYAYRTFKLNDDSNVILALKNETIEIKCETETPMAYCGFVHPSGKRYSFSGRSLDNGKCSFTVKMVSESDVGEWRCHIGKRTIGVELSQRILVRVVDQVAAMRAEVKAIHGKEITLLCITTKGNVPLRYCRFEPPNGSPFSIDAAVKPTQPILGKYFYPQNKSLDRGDCAVSINKVKYTDVGEWTCGAGLDDGKEYTDVIKLEVEGLYTMSTASTTGITFGVVAIVLFLTVLGVVVWKKRRLMGSSSACAQSPEIAEMHELRAAQGSPSQISRQSTRTTEAPTIEVPAITVQSPSDSERMPSPMQNL